MAKQPSAKKAAKAVRKAAAKSARTAAKPARKAASKAASKAAPKAVSKAANTPANKAAGNAAHKGASKTANHAVRGGARNATPTATRKAAAAKPAAKAAATTAGRGSKPATALKPASALKSAAALKSAPALKPAVASKSASKTAAKAGTASTSTNAPAVMLREIAGAREASSAVMTARAAATAAGPLSDPNLNRALAAAVREERSGLGKYVYCIVRATSPLSFGPIGIGGEPADVYTVNWRDLAAVISDSPPGVQDPTRENVLAHQRVNETVMMEHTVLPMSFGTVFKTREDIIEFLRSAHEAFADVLNKMENKLEFGLKVLWDRDAVLLELEQDDEDIRRLKSEIASQKGSTYFARMQYGRLVDAALQARSERYVAEIFDGLRDVAVAARSNKPIGDRMIMNAAFLVSRPEEPAFDARVKALGARYDKLTFKYTGPWPPYNFVNIRLKLERA